MEPLISVASLTEPACAVQEDRPNGPLIAPRTPRSLQGNGSASTRTPLVRHRPDHDNAGITGDCPEAAGFPASAVRIPQRTAGTPRRASQCSATTATGPVPPPAAHPPE